METMPPAHAPIVVANARTLRNLYLRRLRRLLDLRFQHEDDLNGRGVRLLDRSIFAAYCDCRDAGAGQEARRILHEAQFAIDQSSLDGDAEEPS